MTFFPQNTNMHTNKNCTLSNFQRRKHPAVTLKVRVKTSENSSMKALRTLGKPSSLEPWKLTESLQQSGECVHIKVAESW